MTPESDRPAGMSGIYPQSQGAPDLFHASTNQARVLDRYLQTFKAHNVRIVDLEVTAEKRGEILDKLKTDVEVMIAVNRRTIAIILGLFSVAEVVIQVTIHFLAK